MESETFMGNGKTGEHGSRAAVTTARLRLIPKGHRNEDGLFDGYLKKFPDRRRRSTPANPAKATSQAKEAGSGMGLRVWEVP